MCDGNRLENCSGIYYVSSKFNCFIVMLLFFSVRIWNVSYLYLIKFISCWATKYLLVGQFSSFVIIVAN